MQAFPIRLQTPEKAYDAAMQPSTPESFPSLAVPEQALPFEVSAELAEQIAQVGKETEERVRGAIVYR